MSQQDELMKGFDGLDNKESINYQTKKWAEGFPLHNPVRDECTPDFSCCIGVDSMMPKEVRERFVKAVEEGDDNTKTSILYMGLSGISAMRKKNVHIVGEDTAEN